MFAVGLVPLIVHFQLPTKAAPLAADPLGSPLPQPMMPKPVSSPRTIIFLARSRIWVNLSPHRFRIIEELPGSASATARERRKGRQLNTPLSLTS
jgi:hypothetical protein